MSLIVCFDPETRVITRVREDKPARRKPSEGEVRCTLARTEQEAREWFEGVLRALAQERSRVRR